MKATYVHVNTNAPRPALPALGKKRFEPDFLGYVFFFIGSIVLCSTGVGMVIGLVLFLAGMHPNRDVSEPTPLYACCNFLGKIGLVVGVICAVAVLIMVGNS